MIKNEGKICLAEGCNDGAKVRLLCRRHYQAALKDGLPKFTAEDRFWSKVDKHGGYPDFSDPLVSVTEADGECWIWTGSTGEGGYGSFWIDGRLRNAHRVLLAWQDNCSMDRKERADHLCRVRPCVRPNHLEWVSHRLNVLRGAMGVIRSPHKPSVAIGWDEAVTYMKKNGSIPAVNPYRETPEEKARRKEKE